MDDLLFLIKLYYLFQGSVVAAAAAAKMDSGFYIDNEIDTKDFKKMNSGAEGSSSSSLSGGDRGGPHHYAKAEFERGRGDAVWQPVNGTRHKFYVYSAFFDPRLGRKVIRVMAVTKTKNSDKVWCGLHYESKTRKKTRVVAATVTVIRENWNLKYSAAFVICPLPVPMSSGAAADASIQDSFPNPEAVSLFSSADGLMDATNRLPVLNRNEVEPLIGTLGVCVKPIHFNYNKTLELVEFIELNRLLGVSSFTFYNDSMSDQVSCVLRSYQKTEDIDITVLDWKLNVPSQTEIRTEGLFAALNDCLYRSMNHVQYLALIDFDEFIVPRYNKTLPEMLKHIDVQKARGAIASSGGGGGGGAALQSRMRVRPTARVTSSYSFQNAFFYLQFPDDEQEKKSKERVGGNDETNLRTMKKTRRKAKFNPQKQVQCRSASRSIA
jgi:hypothetical protein